MDRAPKPTSEPWRLWIFPAVLGFGFVLIFARLVYIQVIQGPRVSTNHSTVARIERTAPIRSVSVGASLTPRRSFFSRLRRALSRRGVRW